MSIYGNMTMNWPLYSKYVLIKKIQPKKSDRERYGVEQVLVLIHMPAADLHL
jgi:hypothetical protein